MSRGGRGGGRRGPTVNGQVIHVDEDFYKMSKEQDPTYPPLEPLPVLTQYSDAETRICELQLGFADRMCKSPYYITEVTKSTELPRYSDKYRISATAQIMLKRKDLHAPFFPAELYEDYFDPKKKNKKKKTKKRTNSVDIDLDDNDEEKTGDEQSQVGSQVEEEDYDVDEEFDNDYAENYFDNGEGDDMDGLGDGVGGGDDGGGDYD